MHASAFTSRRSSVPTLPSTAAPRRADKRNSWVYHHIASIHSRRARAAPRHSLADIITNTAAKRPAVKIVIPDVDISVETGLRSPSTLVKTLKLRDVITDPVGVIYFSGHLKKEYSHENIVFWRAVENFKIKFGQGSDASRLKPNALLLYNQFFGENSLMEVNVSYKMAERLRQRFERGDVDVDVFNETQAEIFKLMNQDSFKRFKNSQLFLRFVKAYSKRHANVVAEGEKVNCIAAISAHSDPRTPNPNP